MRLTINLSRRRIAALGVLAAVVIGGGFGAAYAAGAFTPNSDTTVIQACEQTNGGLLSLFVPKGSIRIVDDNQTDCRRGEIPISWNAEGEPGAAGATILSGSGTPGDDTGAPGDFYLDTATSTLYGPKTANGWPDTGTSLVGPQGAAGATGQTGAPGNNGATILSGSGAPAADAGNIGDFYMDTATSTIYGPKTESGWPATGTSLVGPPGQAGPAGSATAIFDTPNTSTLYTVPSGVTYLEVQLVSGGGGGGGGIALTGGGGGGSGAYVRAIVPVVAGGTCIIAVGGGGAGGTPIAPPGVNGVNSGVTCGANSALAIFGGGGTSGAGGGSAGPAGFADATGAAVILMQQGEPGRPGGSEFGGAGGGMSPVAGYGGNGAAFSAGATKGGDGIVIVTAVTTTTP